MPSSTKSGISISVISRSLGRKGKRGMRRGILIWMMEKMQRKKRIWLWGIVISQIRLIVLDLFYLNKV
jgi:hypothetical protein